MAKITDMDDCKQTVASLTVQVEHLAKGLNRLEKVVEKHIEKHGQMWFWLIPTLISLGTLLVLLLRCSGG